MPRSTKLEFSYRPSFGKHRYYPENEAAALLCSLGRRICLTDKEVYELDKYFEVRITQGIPEDSDKEKV